jgi:hypothetical protein
MSGLVSDVVADDAVNPVVAADITEATAGRASAAESGIAVAPSALLCFSGFDVPLMMAAHETRSCRRQ